MSIKTIHFNRKNRLKKISPYKKYFNFKILNVKKPQNHHLYSFLLAIHSEAEFSSDRCVHKENSLRRALDSKERKTYLKPGWGYFSFTIFSLDSSQNFHENETPNRKIPLSRFERPLYLISDLGDHGFVSRIRDGYLNVHNN